MIPSDKNSGGARPSDQALVPTASSPQAVSTKGFDPSRFAEPGYDEFGKISLDAAGEALGLVHGLRAERADHRFRCNECSRMSPPGSWLVWVEVGLRKDDPEWAFEDSAVYRGGHWSGEGWCLDCAPKRKTAKATLTRSAKTPKDGLVRRIVARCREAFAQSGSSEQPR